MWQVVFELGLLFPARSTAACTCPLNQVHHGKTDDADYMCAGRQLVQATSKQRPPLGASPRLSNPLAAARPPSFPNTPPITAASLPTASFLTSTQVQGRPVVNHPLQVGIVC